MIAKKIKLVLTVCRKNLWSLRRIIHERFSSLGHMAYGERPIGICVGDKVVAIINSSREYEDDKIIVDKVAEISSALGIWQVRLKRWGWLLPEMIAPYREYYADSIYNYAGYKGDKIKVGKNVFLSPGDILKVKEKILDLAVCEIISVDSRKSNLRINVLVSELINASSLSMFLPIEKFSIGQVVDFDGKHVVVVKNHSPVPYLDIAIGNKVKTVKYHSLRVIGEEREFSYEES